MIRRRRGWRRKLEVDLSEYAYPTRQRRTPTSAIVARLVLLGGLALGALVASGTIGR